MGLESWKIYLHEKHKFKPFMHRFNIPYMEHTGNLYKYNQTMQTFELLFMCVCALYTYTVFVHYICISTYLLLWSTPLGADVDMTDPTKETRDRTLMGPTLLGRVPASWGKPPQEIPTHYTHTYPFNKIQTQLCAI